MKTTFVLAALGMTMAMGVVACGSNSTTSESRVMGEPDFKSADGIKLIDWIKKAENAKNVCATLSHLKAQGFDAFSAEATNAVSQQFRLHPTEAEVVNTYVVEFTCPENGR